MHVHELSRVSPRLPFLALAVVIGTLGLAFPGPAQITCPSGQTTASNPCIFTSQYDNKRSGFNGFETTLDPGTVSNMGSTAQHLFEVDDNFTYTQQLPATYRSNPVYAQPLYVPGITINTQAYNMLVAVTLNDTIFAWDTATNNLPWSRQGVPTGENAQNPPGSAGNALWRDDCGLGGSPVIPGTTVSLPYWGILSTPVIDISVAGSGSTPVMFVVDHCQTSAPQPRIYIHEIDLTTGMDVVAGGATQFRNIGSDLGSNFQAGRERQRSALLEVKNSGTSLIYIPFAAGVSAENDAKNKPYHGWLTGYTVSSSYVLSPATNFVFSTTPTACPNGTNGGLGGQQCTNNGGTPACDCYESAGYPNAPNWGGQGVGCWMTGKGMAATGVGDIESDGWVHAFLGCGNGGFQTFTDSTPFNYGESIMDFRLTSSGFDISPFQSFTPNGSAASVVIKPTPPDNVCNCSPTCSACTTTLQTLNVNDLDQSLCGILLFDDASGNHWLVTCDKFGDGYLLKQGKLCGSSYDDSTCTGWDPADPGDWPFGMTRALCPSTGTACDITSLAFYNTTPGSTSGLALLYFWQNNDRLTAYQLSDNSTAMSGGTNITWQSTTPTIITTAGACTVGTSCLSSFFVPGDTITASGTGCGGSPAAVVTGVSDSTATSGTICGTAGGPCATISPAFPTSTCSPPVSFTYKGYFINPARDDYPGPDVTGYPGSSVIVTAKWDTTQSPHQYINGVVWGLEPGDNAGETTRDKGYLRAYRAIPNSSNQLYELWYSTDSFCLSSFALPTIANGRVYVPTYAARASGTGNCPTSGDNTTYKSGINAYY